MRRADATAREMTRIFDARCAAGVVSRESLCTLIDEYLQAVDPVSGDLNYQNVKIKLSRGAQPGNRNRLIHGRRMREHVALMAAVRDHIQQGRELMAACKHLLRR